MRGSGFLLRLLTGVCLAGISATTSPAAENCPPCLAFDRLDKQIRDGRLPKTDASRQLAALTTELETYLAGTGAPTHGRAQWTFPLRGYNLAAAGADADKGYNPAGYDYFAGNRHGGHPSFDLFIRDRNQDCLDDRTGQPVTVVAMTGGIVVAAEPQWEAGSPLRGGKYLWIYDPASQLLVYYAHNRDLLVGVGDRVAPGTPIATVGRSGFNAAKRRSPTHLHLTVLTLRDGRPVPANIHRQLREILAVP
jgi:hypothetical protein